MSMPMSTYTRRWMTALAALGLLATAGCGKPGGQSSNLTNSIVSITSINNNAVLQSDIIDGGSSTDDFVTVELTSQPRDLGDIVPTELHGDSSFDTITFHSYHISHRRSDGGPNPASFTMGTHLSLPASTSSKTAELVVVRAFDKERSPLRELQDDGQIVTTSTLTLYGEDGYGNDVAVSGSLIISFGNFQ